MPKALVHIDDLLVEPEHQPQAQGIAEIQVGAHVEGQISDHLELAFRSPPALPRHLIDANGLVLGHFTCAEADIRKTDI